MGIEHERSLVEGIARVPPGATAHVTGGRIQIEPCPAAPVSRFRSSPSAVAHLRSALGASVQSAFEPGAEVAVLASGGLDSSVIAALAAEHGAAVTLASAPAHLMSGVELSRVRTLKRFLDVDHYHGEDWPLASALTNANRGANHPRGGLFAGVFESLAAKAAERGATAVLTGDGGDDLFGIQGLVLADALVVARRQLPAIWVEVAAMSSRGSAGTAVTLGVAPLLARRSARLASRLLRKSPLGLPLLREEFVREYSARRRLARLRDWARVPSGALAAHTARHDLLAAAESTFTLPSPDGRPLPRHAPFRDPALLETVASAGAWSGWARGGHSEKWLLRLAMAGSLPEQIRLGQKPGQAELARRVIESDIVPLKDLLGTLHARLPDVISEEAVALERVHESGADSTLWVRLLCLGAWLDGMDRRVGGHVTL